MGNAAFCAASIITGPPTIKVLGWDGTVRVYAAEQVKVAAEIMVENPGQFVCDPNTLQVGRRISGLSADEELDGGSGRPLYFLLLPMEMLYSTLTDEEMRYLSYVASKANLLTSKQQPAGGGGGGLGCRAPAAGRMIFPVSFGEFICLAGKTSMVVDGDINNINDSNYSSHDHQGHLSVTVVEFNTTTTSTARSCSRQRSWKPALETIVEATS